MFTPKIPDQETLNFCLRFLNDQVGQLLRILEAMDKAAFKRFMKVKWLKEFYSGDKFLTKYR